MPRIIRVIAAFGFLSVSAAVFAADVPAASAKKEFAMGVFPHLPPRDLEEVFGPMAQDLSLLLGHSVVLGTSTTFERFSESLDRGQYDIAFVQPFEYVRIADRHGYVPLATRTERLRGVIVASQDSVITDVADLKGKRLALPPVSAAVTQLITGHLAQNGLKPGRDVTVSHHRSHVSCMQQVLIAEADACGTAAPSIRFFQNKMKVELKTIATTNDIPSSLFVAHPRVPESERARVRDRIVDWSNTEEGKKILSRGELTPFIKISDRDYDVVRRIAKTP